MLRRDRAQQAISTLRGKTEPQRQGGRPEAGAALARILGGRWEDTGEGPVFLRDVRYPLSHLHGEIPLGAPLKGDAGALSTILGISRPLEAARLGFFDIETTGLSGGTGTYAFLVCLGAFEADAFRVRQYFLADLEHEGAMLDLLARDLSRLDGIVSYNGRTFDLPLIQTRWTLARISDPCGDLPHLDLLHAVRRLYRHRLRSCRLADAERRLLRFRRNDDVPGSEAPGRYFDYLRAGRISPLRGVFRHNAWDVLSIVGILAAVLDLFAGKRPDPLAAVSLGRWWELENRPERAERFYRIAVEGLSESSGHGENWSLAARRFALLRKRAGARREVIPIWERLWARGDAAAAIEIAKYLEHEARDLRAAEKITRAVLHAAAPADRADVAHRLARLERKLRKHG